MSGIRAGDEDLHHEDGSHRWIAPPNVDQGGWEDRIRAHQEEHRSPEVWGLRSNSVP